MPIVRLVNYPSGDPVFDQLFEETQPDWVVKDAEDQIAKESACKEMFEALKQIIEDSDEIYPEHTDIKIAKSVIKQTEKYFK